MSDTADVLDLTDAPAHRAPFTFLDPGPLIDRELQLIPPTPAWLDDIVAACTHPLTARENPAMARPGYTREQVRAFLESNPLGHEPPDPDRNKVPAYHFLMLLPQGSPLRIAGGIGLRIGQSPNLQLYLGHIGYHVYPPARGRHYAERACRLLLPLARRHGLTELWITCNPDNTPSRRTCQRLGADYMGTVNLPKSHNLWDRGERQKCRYRLRLYR